MWSTCGRGAISERRDDLGAYESVLPYEARPIVSCRSTSATRPSAPFRFQVTIEKSVLLGTNRGKQFRKALIYLRHVMHGSLYSHKFESTQTDRPCSYIIPQPSIFFTVTSLLHICDCLKIK